MLGLASLYCLRMLGLFMVLPLFAVYAQELAGANAASIGLALGAYGLTQAAFQVPLGWLSDQIGRKPVIVGGLCLLVLGSVLAALANTSAYNRGQHRHAATGPQRSGARPPAASSCSRCSST